MTDTQVTEVSELSAAGPSGDGVQTRFVPRRSASPLRESDMIRVEAEDVDDPATVDRIDALEELLALDTDREIRQEVDMTPELKGRWVVQAMGNDLNQQLIEQATYYRENPRTHEQIRTMDNIEFTRLVVAHCTVEPNLMDPTLFRKHGITMKRPDQLVAKILLPGQIDRLAGAIMRLSGFRDDLVEVAKNSSRKAD